MSKLAILAFYFAVMSLFLADRPADAITTPAILPALGTTPVPAGGPGVVLAPPMGWNDWNHFGCGVSESIIEKAANALVTSGMSQVGYRYVNVDDCWMASHRDPRGNLQADPVRFPHGMPVLIQYVHHLGLRFGIYEDAGTATCKRYPGSYGHEASDAALFARWGVDYLKYDFCHHPSLNWTPDFDRFTLTGDGFSAKYEAEGVGSVLTGGARVSLCASCSGGAKVGYVGGGSGALSYTLTHIPSSGTYRLSIDFISGTPGHIAFLTVNGADRSELHFPGSGGWSTVATLSTHVTLHEGTNTMRLDNPMSAVDNARYLYVRMRTALLRSGRAIVLDVNDPMPETTPWRWAAEIGSMWRTYGDIKDTWPSMMAIVQHQARLAGYAGPGHWNDPDMLEVGNGGMSPTEYRAQFSLWCILAGPLIAGNDLTTMDSVTRSILTNPEAIAVDQDPAGVQGTAVSSGPDYQIWEKRLSDGSRALVILDLQNGATVIHLSPGDVGLTANAPYIVRDLWAHRSSLATGETTVPVDGHGVAMLVLKPPHIMRNP